MNNKQYLFITDMINIILRFIIALCIMGPIFLFITGNMDDVWMAWYLIPAPFLSYLIEKRTNHFWSYLVFHALFIATYIMILHNNILSFVFGFYLIIMTIIPIIKKSRKSTLPSNTRLAFIAFIVGCYYYSIYVKSANLKTLFFLLTFLYVLLYLLNHYLINFRNYFLEHEDMAKLPIQQIVFSNHFLFASFGMLCIGTMLTFTLLPMNEILSSVGRFIARILKLLFSFIHFNVKTGKILPPEEGRPIPMPPGDNLLLKILSTILYYAIILALIYVIIAGLIFIFNHLYKMFYTKRANVKDKLEFLSPFDREQKIERKNPRPIRRMYLALFGKTNNEKIRKHYYNAVITNADSDRIPKQLTPTQLTLYAFQTDNQYSDRDTTTQKEKEITDLYEKARYGKEECTKKDIKRIKELLNHK